MSCPIFCCKRVRSRGAVRLYASFLISGVSRGTNTVIWNILVLNRGALARPYGYPMLHNIFAFFPRGCGSIAGTRRTCFVTNAAFFALASCLGIFLLNGCGNSGDLGARSDRLAPIRVTRAVKEDVPRILEAVGNVEAFSSVQVKSQVGGQIVEVPVVAGQEVTAGDVLFRLDPRPFDAAVAEAEARLARDQAMLTKADQDLARYRRRIKQDVVSKEAYDQVIASEKTIQADIQQALAAIQTAKLNREFSVITAPVSGKLGDILVRLGNVIKANDERTLVVINSLRPAEVQFTVA